MNGAEMKKKNSLKRIGLIACGIFVLVLPLILLGLTLTGITASLNNKFITMDTYVIAGSVLLTGIALIQFSLIKDILRSKIYKSL